MAKAKKKSPTRPAQAQGHNPSHPSLAPKVLEEAAQGWLQSLGTSAPATRPAPAVSDQRLAEALTQTLQQLRSEIAELRGRLDRMENL